MAASVFGLGGMEVLFLLLFGGGLGLPVGMPPLPPDPVMQSAAPEECLYYMAWNGTAEPDPSSANQTEQLLAEPEIRAFLAHVERALTNGVGQNAALDAQMPMLLQTGSSLLKVLITRPTMLYVSHVEIKQQGPDVRGVLVINAGEGAAQLRRTLAQLEGLLPTKSKEVTLGGVKFRQALLDEGMPQVFWGFKKEYLIVAVGSKSAEEVVSRLGGKGKPPAWLTTLNKRLQVDRPASTTYFNLAGALKIAQPMMTDKQVTLVLKATGVDKISSVSSVTGLDASGTITKTLVATEGEPSGILSALSAQPLSVGDLQPIAVDANFAAAARVDLAELWARVLEGIGEVEPQAKDELQRQVGQMEEGLGFRLSEDLLKALGDVWCIYNSPNEGGALFTGICAAVDIRDGEKLERTHELLLGLARGSANGAGPGSPAMIHEFEFRGQQVYYWQSSSDPLPFAPAWCLTKDHLVVALYPQTIKAWLSRDAKAGSLATLPLIAEQLSSSEAPSVISYQDNASLLGLGYSILQLMAPVISTEAQKAGISLDLHELPSFAAISPHVTPAWSSALRLKDGLLFEQHQSVPAGAAGLTSWAPIAVGLMLPAVQSARGVAFQARAGNNMRMLGVAMHNYHAVYNKFPAGASTDAQGKPLLSWRVLILPYIEQQPLFDQFHLDEPWDSEHNRALIPLMPEMYATPGLEQVNSQGMTVYLLPTGEKVLFDVTRDPRISDVLDGTSNTIMIVEANPDRAVTWTKPDDLVVDMEQPWAGLGGVRPGGFQAIFGDGALHFIKSDTSPDTVRAMFTPAGNELFQFND